MTPLPMHSRSWSSFSQTHLQYRSKLPFRIYPVCYPLPHLPPQLSRPSLQSQLSATLWLSDFRVKLWPDLPGITSSSPAPAPFRATSHSLEHRRHPIGLQAFPLPPHFFSPLSSQWAWKLRSWPPSSQTPLVTSILHRTPGSYRRQSCLGTWCCPWFSLSLYSPHHFSLMNMLQLQRPGHFADTPPGLPLPSLPPRSSAVLGHSLSDGHLTCSSISFSFLPRCSPLREVFSTHLNKNGTACHALVFSLALSLRDITQQTLVTCRFYIWDLLTH